MINYVPLLLLPFTTKMTPAEENVLRSFGTFFRIDIVDISMRFMVYGVFHPSFTLTYTLQS